MNTFRGQETKRKFLAHEDYPSIANLPNKSPTIFRGTFEIFTVFFLLEMFIHITTFCETLVGGVLSRHLF
jgi:hypothetical protein